MTDKFICNECGAEMDEDEGTCEDCLADYEEDNSVDDDQPAASGRILTHLEVNAKDGY